MGNEKSVANRTYKRQTENAVGTWKHICFEPSASNVCIYIMDSILKVRVVALFPKWHVVSFIPAAGWQWGAGVLFRKERKKA